MRTAAVLPVKGLDGAKQRLGTARDMQGATRRALAEAMVVDVLTALRRSKAIEATFVVTAAASATELARGHGARVIADDGERGQSAAAERGVAAVIAEGFDRALLVPGDCPALDPVELDAMLERHRDAAVIVPDRHGTGTNALLLSPPDAFAPMFGDGSRERHEQAAADAGLAYVVEEGLASLALDVDTPEDLEALRALLAARRGGAAHTRGLLNQLDRANR